ncbi:merozoite surface protein 4 [Plasmodium sp. gorilla clade G3]|nr:merozoite surface protein 4 [Plasmodium sp. gorilla clade G3]
MWIVKFLIIVGFFIICTIYFDKLYISYSYNIIPENGSMLNRRILEEDKTNVEVRSISDTSGKNGPSSVSPNSSSTEGTKDENKRSEQEGQDSDKKENPKEIANEKGDAKEEEKDNEEKGGEKTYKVQEEVLENSPKKSPVVDDREKNEAIPEKVAQPSSSTSDVLIGEEEEDDEGDEEEDDEDDNSSNYDTSKTGDLDDEDLCKHNNGDCGDDKICEYVGNRRVKCKCKEGYKLEGIECVELFSLASSSLNLIFNSFITIFVVILLIN